VGLEQLLDSKDPQELYSVVVSRNKAKLARRMEW
jgi:hypothetical protein